MYCLRSKVHSCHRRTLADLLMDGRSVVVQVRFPRFLCWTRQCGNTFRGPVSRRGGTLSAADRPTARVPTVLGELLPDCRSDTLEARLRTQPGVEVIVRDRSASDAEAVHFPTLFGLLTVGICERIVDAPAATRTPPQAASSAARRWQASG